MTKVTFINPDAAESRIEFQVEEAALRYICRWYGGLYSGDNYEIYADGELLCLDQFGELL